MPKISLSIMAVPWRKKNVDTLLAQLPEARVIWDMNRSGIWPTASRAWGSYDPQASHHLVLQDDTALCKNFLEHLERAVAANSQNILTLWGGRNKRAAFQYARKNGLSWWVGEVDIRVVACCMPIPIIQDWLAWCSLHIDPRETQYDDMRLDAYLLTHNKMYWQTCPELVEHLGAQQSTTRVSHPGRVAYLFQEPGRQQDWSKGVIPQRTFYKDKTSYLSYLKEYSL